MAETSHQSVTVYGAKLIEHDMTRFAPESTWYSERISVATRGERGHDVGAQMNIQLVGGNDYTGACLPDFTAARWAEVDQVDVASADCKPYRHRHSF